MLDFLKKVLGNGNDTQLKKLEKPVGAVMALENEYRKLTDEQLQAKTAEFKTRLANGETEDDLLPEAFATVREAADRVLGMRPYRVQVLGGIVLHQGRIAEMKTGEGKTLVSTMPAYLNALRGEGVHIVTVNDYLARRDSEWMGKVHRFLGLSVGLIVHDLDSAERQKAYACDITYGTNNELGFDYLRDNMVIRQSNLVQRGHAFAIVDEVDSILIDEARTPLIISGQGEKSTELYDRVDAVVRTMKPGVHFEVEEKKKAVTLTDEGAQKVETAFSIDNINDPENSELNHHVNCALRAHNLMKRDVDYVVQNGQVIIVDEFTGRLMIGRRYSEGLHQAIEAKEHVKVERESKTLATITFQNYFRMYKKLSGMTGTAKTEEAEFQGIYALDVVEIPTNKPNIRNDLEDMVYKNKNAKFNAVVTSIEERHKTGQPLLALPFPIQTFFVSAHALRRYKERSLGGEDLDFVAVCDRLVRRSPYYVCAGSRTVYGTTKYYVMVMRVADGMFLGYYDSDRNVTRLETFISVDMLSEHQKNLSAFKYSDQMLRDQRDMVLGKIPFNEELSRSMDSSRAYINGADELKEMSSEDIAELREIAKEEYDAIPEEEHQRRIAEQQEANRERYDRKMMRKGYK